MWLWFMAEVITMTWRTIDAEEFPSLIKYLWTFCWLDPGIPPNPLLFSSPPPHHTHTHTVCSTYPMQCPFLFSSWKQPWKLSDLLNNPSVQFIDIIPVFFFINTKYNWNGLNLEDHKNTHVQQCEILTLFLLLILRNWRRLHLQV